MIDPAAVERLHGPVGQFRIGIFGQHGAHERLGSSHLPLAQIDHQQRDVGQVGVGSQIDGVLQVGLRRRKIVRAIIVDNPAHEESEPVIRSQVDDLAIILDDLLARVGLGRVNRLGQHIQRQRPGGRTDPPGGFEVRERCLVLPGAQIRQAPVAVDQRIAAINRQGLRQFLNGLRGIGAVVHQGAMQVGADAVVLDVAAGGIDSAGIHQGEDQLVFATVRHAEDVEQIEHLDRRRLPPLVGQVHPDVGRLLDHLPPEGNMGKAFQRANLDLKLDQGGRVIAPDDDCGLVSLGYRAGFVAGGDDRGVADDANPGIGDALFKSPRQVLGHKTGDVAFRHAVQRLDLGDQHELFARLQRPGSRVRRGRGRLGRLWQGQVRRKEGRAAQGTRLDRLDIGREDVRL